MLYSSGCSPSLFNLNGGSRANDATDSELSASGLASPAGEFNQLSAAPKKSVRSHRLEETRRSSSRQNEQHSGTKAPASPVIEGAHRPEQWLHSGEFPQRPGHSEEIIEIKHFSSEGKEFLLSADKSGEVLGWDLRKGQAFLIFSSAQPISAADFSPAQALGAVASGSTVEVFSLQDGQRAHHLKRLSTRVTHLAFHPSRAELLIAGADSRVYRWFFAADDRDLSLLDQEKLLERYVGHASVVSVVEYHPDGRVFLSGDWSGRLYTWLGYDEDPYRGEYDENVLPGGGTFSGNTDRKRAPRSETSRVEKLLFDPQGEFFYLASQDGDLEIWDLRGLRRLKKKSIHKGLIYDAAMSRNGKYIVSCGRDSSVRLWSIALSEVEGKHYTSPELSLVGEERLADVRSVAVDNSGAVFAGSSSGELKEVVFPDLPGDEEKGDE